MIVPIGRLVQDSLHPDIIVVVTGHAAIRAAETSGHGEASRLEP